MKQKLYLEIDAEDKLLSTRTFSISLSFGRIGKSSKSRSSKDLKRREKKFIVTSFFKFLIDKFKLN